MADRFIITYNGQVQSDNMQVFKTYEAIYYFAKTKAFRISLVNIGKVYKYFNDMKINVNRHFNVVCVNQT